MFIKLLKVVCLISFAKLTFSTSDFQPFLGPSQYHWLSFQLPNGGDLHALCPTSCNDVFQRVPVQVARVIIEYLDPISIVRASRKDSNLPLKKIAPQLYTF